MEKAPISPGTEEDKFKKAPARRANAQEKDTQFLDGDALWNELVDPSEVDDGVPVEKTKDDEWEAREDDQKSH